MLSAGRVIGLLHIYKGEAPYASQLTLMLKGLIILWRLHLVFCGQTLHVDGHRIAQQHLDEVSLLRQLTDLRPEARCGCGCLHAAVQSRALYKPLCPPLQSWLRAMQQGKNPDSCKHKVQDLSCILCWEWSLSSRPRLPV